MKECQASTEWPGMTAGRYLTGQEHDMQHKQKGHLCVRVQGNSTLLRKCRLRKGPSQYDVGGAQQNTSGKRAKARFNVNTYDAPLRSLVKSL